MNEFKLARILSTDGLDRNGVQALRDFGFDVVEQKFSKSELIQQLINFDAIIVRSATTIDAEIIRAVTSYDGSRLKVIARAGTGVDNIDVEVATEKGLLVINTPAANTISAAEHTVALMCSLSRQIPQAHSNMKQGKWDRKLYMGTELLHKTLAIIGLGKIGKEVALRAQAFGMTTIGFDPIIGNEEAKSFNVDWMELNEIWPIADYISVHVPLIPQTENLINLKTIEKCKPSVKFINCARGGIINEDDLLKSLEMNLCSGAALDVFTEEPPTFNNLIKHPKLIVTPHLGASTVEAQFRVSMEIAENLISITKGESIPGSVNGHAIETSNLKQIQLLKILLTKISPILKNYDIVELSYKDNYEFCSNRALENFIKSYLAMEILKLRNVGSSINLINSMKMALGKNLTIVLRKMDEKDSCLLPKLAVKVGKDVMVVTLMKERLFLTKFNEIEIFPPVFIGSRGHLLIVSDDAKAHDILCQSNHNSDNSLINYSYQQENHFHIFIMKRLKEKIAEDVKLSLQI